MIKMVDLHKSYRVGTEELKVLKGIDLEIKQGSMVAIMGRSGSGKSTLLNIISGLEKGNGRYTFKDQNLSDKSLNELADFRRKHIGFVLQNCAMCDSKNVFDNVALPLRYGKYNEIEIQNRVEQALEAMELSGTLHKTVDMLSGGELQRVAIARALIHNPEVILADEPTGSLDEQTEQTILSIFKQLHREGKTIIIVTHDRQVADACEETFCIRDGKIRSD
ncbi:ABC transporter ATP-binding protein [Paenibacillus sp. MER TA 81-3]|uniref:ABC transporter ATP-binding protein n=1 Tax=Paenibacillus sp. MER TA 81-3 TaxID=2939573 RepID=UPI00203D27DB|nr:ABC transporter ATP-binding protein [Paenibacillus sp. MER TA 81-3]MCM3337975.1 ABC transporter ATP-binding protein [Paenibacillus sp. MER TA 81-3]